MGERRSPLSEKFGRPREFGEAPHTRSGARRAPKDRSFTNFGRGGILYPIISIFQIYHMDYPDPGFAKLKCSNALTPTYSEGSIPS